MPKQNKNNDVSGAVTVKPKKSTPKKTKKNTTKTPEKKKRGAPSQYANKVKPYLADIERIQQAIARGDCYQINYTLRLHLNAYGDPIRLYQRLSGRRGRSFLPDVNEFIGYWRLRDWLRLLNFEVDDAQFGCYRPAVRTEQWLEKFSWMDAVGDRCWPILGAVYFVVGIKRVHGMRLLEPAWRASPQRATATMPIARRHGKH